MKKILNLIAVLSVLTLGLLVAPVYASESNSMGWDRSYQASEIIGLWVTNHEGKYLGRVQDFVFDPDGHVIFAIVGYSRFTLRVGGRTVAYYNIAGGSMGFVIGAEKKDLVLLFMQDEALQHFRTSSNWTAGFDGAITVIDTGKEGYTDTVAMNAPVVAFAFAERGLMFDASIEGTKFSRMDKQG